MPIRALIFDLWGTLIEEVPERAAPRVQARARGAADALARGGHARSEEAVAAALRAYSSEHDVLALAGRDRAMPDRVARVLELIEPPLGVLLDDRTLLAVEDALAGAIRLYPPVPIAGSHEALEEGARRGLALGLISNTGISPGCVVRGLLAEAGLLPYFRAQTYSDEACFSKPAPEMFRCTLEALGVAAEQAVYVGDTPITDVAGARAAGMWTVLIGNRHTDGIEPDARIATLPELFAALEGLGLL